MRAKLPPPNDDRDYGAEFDAAFGVRDWQVPGSTKVIITRVVDPNRDPDAPAWWTGDEDASQSFLMSVGARL